MTMRRLLSHAALPPRWPAGIRNRSVVVGISGGVDSSVAAMLLRDAGWDVQGVFIRSWDRSEEDAVSRCSETADMRAAEAVCRELNIPFRTVDLSREYWTRVFEPFLAVYAAGSTPNPDTDCNRFVKFGAFRDFALRELRADCVATGHYARLFPAIDVSNPEAKLPPAHASVDAPPPRLVCAADAAKDQTDFLSLVGGEQLRRVIFPLGDMLKPAVRALAAARSLSSATRRDSYGICLVGKRGLPGFLSGYLPLTPGCMRDVSSGGAVIATHAGAELRTVGQGARISGAPHPYYIVGKSPAAGTLAAGAGGRSDGTLWVVPGRNHPALFSRVGLLRLSDMAWVAGAPPPSVASAEAAARRRCVSEPTPLQRPVLPGELAALEQTALGRAAARWPITSLRYRLRHSQTQLQAAVATVAWRSEVERLGQVDVVAGWLRAQQATAAGIPVEEAAVPTALTQTHQPFVWHVRGPPRLTTAGVRPGPAPQIGKRSCTTGQPGEGARGPGADELLLVVIFARSQRAVAPGQVVSFYDAGGGAAELAQSVSTASGTAAASESAPVSEAGEPPSECFGGGSVLSAGPSLWDCSEVLPPDSTESSHEAE